MKLALPVLLLLFSFDFARAQCAGAGISNVVQGDKTIAIEISTGTLGQGPKKYAIDDDGLIALNLAASVCFDTLPKPKMNVSYDQEDCARKAQEDLVEEQRIKSFYFSDASDFSGKTSALAVIKAKCSVDFSAEWAKATRAADTTEIPCAAGVQKLIGKANARNQEFLKENTTPGRLAELFESPQDRTLFTQQLKNSTVHTSAFVKSMTARPVTRLAFQKAFEELRLANAQHSYDVLSDPNGEPTADSSKSVPEVMAMLNTRLPYEDLKDGRIRIGRTRCETYPGQRDIDVVAGADWKARGSYQGQQNSKSNGVSK